MMMSLNTINVSLYFFQCSILELLTELSYSEDHEETINDPAAAYKLIKRIRLEWRAIVISTQRSLYEGKIFLVKCANMLQNVFIDIEPLLSKTMTQEVKHWAYMFCFCVRFCVILVDFQELLYSDELKIPLPQDLKGAALGLIRLQEIYKLYPENITRGEMSTLLM